MKENPRPQNKGTGRELIVMDETVRIVDNGRPLTMNEIRQEAVIAAINRNAGNKPAAAAELAISLKNLYDLLPRNEFGDILHERIPRPKWERTNRPASCSPRLSNPGSDSG